MARRRPPETELVAIAREVTSAPRAARRRKKTATRGQSTANAAVETTWGQRTTSTTNAELADDLRAHVGTRRPKAKTSSLAAIADEITQAQRKRSRGLPKTSLADVARAITSDSSPTPIDAGASPLDLALPARPIAMELIAGRGHYERVLRAVLDAKVSVWIATANVKELMVEDHRARPGRRRSLRKAAYVSVLAHLAKGANTVRFAAVSGGMAGPSFSTTNVTVLSMGFLR